MNITVPQLEAYFSRKTSLKELAQAHGVNPNYLCHYLSKHGFKRPPAPEHATRKENSKNRASRTEELVAIAAKVKAKKLTISKAAAAAGCSTRTISRYVAC
jgi:transposase-like protein